MYYNRTTTILAALATGLAGFADVLAAAPSHMQLLVSEEDAEGGLGTLGAFAYDPTQDAFWTVLFGAGTGVRRVDANGAVQYVYPTNVQQLIRSLDVAGGHTDADLTASPLQSAILLNPQAITIDYGSELGPDEQPIGAITYQPGELAFIVDAGLPASTTQSGETTYLIDHTKRLYRYDLRQIGSADAGGIGSPDRNNAQDGAGNVIGAHGQVDWNDVFSVVATERNLRDAAGYESDGRSGSNFGRQFAWSSDGQTIYAVDSSSYTGGIHRIGASTGGVVQLYDAADHGRASAEPTVVSTTTHAFGAGSGDQILFDGHEDHGNAGGISFIVDDGSDAPSPQVALAGSDLQSFLGEDSSSIRSITSDAQGNLYFYEGTSGALLRYDTQGRLASLVNRMQLVSFNEAVNGNGEYRDVGGMLRLQVFEDAEHGTRVFYRGYNAFVAAATVGKVGDFDSDGQITAADTAHFITQFQVERVPSAGTQGYLEYAMADLNASGRVEGNPYGGALLNRAVDNADLDVLREFVNLRAGDTNWDFRVDIADFQTLKSNFNPVGTDATWFDGNFAYQTKGTVDISDFQALKASFNPAESYSPEVDEPAVAMLAAASVPGTLEIRVELDGEVFLVGHDATFDAIQIVGSEESVVESSFAGITGMDSIVGDAFVAALTLGWIELDGELSLGQIYNADLDLRDLAFVYNDSVVGAIQYVPEPGSLLLLGVTSALLYRRRAARGA